MVSRAAWPPLRPRKATFQSLSRTPLEVIQFDFLFSSDEKQRLFTSEFQKSLGGYDTIDVFREHYNRADTTTPSQKSSILTSRLLTDDILAKVDRASMAYRWRSRSAARSPVDGKSRSHSLVVEAEWPLRQIYI